jgi:hypothetical protein
VRPETVPKTHTATMSVTTMGMITARPVKKLVCQRATVPLSMGENVIRERVGAKWIKRLQGHVCVGFPGSVIGLDVRKLTGVGRGGRGEESRNRGWFFVRGWVDGLASGVLQR